MNIENTTINANDFINDLVAAIKIRRESIQHYKDDVVKTVASGENDIAVYLIDRVLRMHLDSKQANIFIGRLNYTSMDV